MSKYKYSERLNKILLERRHVDEEDFPDHCGPALAAYECDCGCINESFWDLAELMGEITRKFRYALLAVIEEKGYTESEVNIVIEPTWEDTTSYVVIRKSDNKVLLDDYCKAWNFGHDGTLDDLEEFLVSLAEDVEEKAA